MCLAVAFALLFISLFLFSPWHRHDRLAPQACSLSQFEHASFDGPAAHIQIAPPVLSALALSGELVVKRVQTRAAPVFGPRAPPASSL